MVLYKGTLSFFHFFPLSLLLNLLILSKKFCFLRSLLSLVLFLFFPSLPPGQEQKQLEDALHATTHRAAVLAGCTSRRHVFRSVYRALLRGCSAVHAALGGENLPLDLNFCWRLFFSSSLLFHFSLFHLTLPF